MQVQLIDKKENILAAEVQQVTSIELNNFINWKFNWTELLKYKKCKVYKIQTQEIEGLMMIEFIDEDFFELKNIEVSPTNYGSTGKYQNVAQILIAYACLLSFEFNKGPYQGYLSFISKGELVDYYIKNYNAELVFRERMQISPINGLKLIKKHLNVRL